MNSARYWQDGYWVASCSAIPTIGLSFATSAPVFTIPPDQMNLGILYRGSSQCLLGLVAESIIGQSLLVGDIFLKVRL